MRPRQLDCRQRKSGSPDALGSPVLTGRNTAIFVDSSTDAKGARARGRILAISSMKQIPPSSIAANRALAVYLTCPPLPKVVDTTEILGREFLACPWK